MAFFAALRPHLARRAVRRGRLLGAPRGDGDAFSVCLRSPGPLITSRFAEKVRATVRGASVDVWSDCGHVPQIEHPERTAQKLLEFYATADRKLAAG